MQTACSRGTTPRPWRCVSSVPLSCCSIRVGVHLLLITVPECLGLREREKCSLLQCVFLVEGSSQTEQLPQGGKSPSGGFALMATAGCPSGAPFANGMSAYVWNIVVLKPGLFVNLLRCLDG